MVLSIFKNMKIKLINHYLDKIFIGLLLIIFFTYNLNRIDYGLPFFVNLDETRYLYSTLSYLKFLTGHYGFGDPIIAPLFSLIFILKSIFINELLINSLNIEEIISKIYFNPELFILYGRIASLIATSLSIFFLYLIFKKLKINFFIYSFLLVTFTSSLITYNVASYHGKHAYYLLFFLLQLYFFFKYLIKIQSFNFKSYIIFGLLGALAWGVSYWPALISIYTIIILHFKKFKFSKINYLIIFFSIFVLLGPILGIIVSDVKILSFITTSDHVNTLDANTYFKSAINDFFEGLRIIFFAEKNLLLLVFLPFFLLNKHSNFKKDCFTLLIIFFYPVILFAISQKAFPQLRYFIGNTCIILILISIIFNEFLKSNLKYLLVIFIFSNCYFIYNNINLNNKLNDVIFENHSFYKFNKNIKQDRNKILYLIDLNFQESLKQNSLYLELYDNDLIRKSKDYETKITRIKNKINKIKNTKDIIIDNNDLKKDITYFNFSYHEINNLKLFFDFIKKNFNYVVIEESLPFYLTNRGLHKEINEYVKDNFEFQKIFTMEDKIFLRSQMSIVHYFANAVNRFDYAKNINDDTIEVTYGSNYSLYKLN